MAATIRPSLPLFRASVLAPFDTVPVAGIVSPRNTTASLRQHTLTFYSAKIINPASVWINRREQVQA
mgnify:CR=1 FL=1